MDRMMTSGDVCFNDMRVGDRYYLYEDSRVSRIKVTSEPIYDKNGNVYLVANGKGDKQYEMFYILSKPWTNPYIYSFDVSDVRKVERKLSESVK